MTEQQIYKSLFHHFAGGRSPYVLLPQVRSSVGYASSRRPEPRTVDALLCRVWPSGPQWMAGIEIKTSRSDWRRELRTPEKTDAIRRYCQRWYCACPAGMLSPDDMGPGWGLITVDDTGRVEVVKRSPVLTADPVDINFLFSVLRSAQMWCYSVFLDPSKHKPDRCPNCGTSDHPPEKCEACGLPLCEACANYDSERVPLCSRCWDALLSEQSPKLRVAEVGT